jgi:Uma2 family endonuclease
MATVTQARKLGPSDRGRPMTLDEFMSGDYQEGYQYELIDGRLYVSPLPNLPQGRIERWIYRRLDRYAEDHPDVINFVYGKCRVFVPNRPGVTNPEPDVSAYRNFPIDADYDEARWQDISPVLVVEVISLDDPKKDLVRNVELYRQVPSIREYWLIDSRESANRPTMLVYRRRGQRWQKPIELAFRDRYTTKLLPGFDLIIDPRR